MAKLFQRWRQLKALLIFSMRLCAPAPLRFIFVHYNMRETQRRGGAKTQWKSKTNELGLMCKLTPLVVPAHSSVANMIHVIIPPEDLEKINSERFRHHDPIIARHLNAKKMERQALCIG